MYEKKYKKMNTTDTTKRNVTPEIRDKIIMLFVEEGWTVFKISQEVKFSNQTINVVLKKYYNEINEQRPKRTKSKVKILSPNPNNLSSEELKKGLIEFLKQGREIRVIRRLAKHYGINIDKELLKYEDKTLKNTKDEGEER